MNRMRTLKTYLLCSIASRVEDGTRKNNVSGHLWTTDSEQSAKGHILDFLQKQYDGSWRLDVFVQQEVPASSMREWADMVDPPAKPEHGTLPEKE